MRNKLATLALAGTLALGSGGCTNIDPKIEVARDMNQDGIQDIQLLPSASSSRYLFLSKGDGTYERLGGFGNYRFISNDGTIYFMDAESKNLRKAKNKYNLEEKGEFYVIDAETNSLRRAERVVKK